MLKELSNIKEIEQYFSELDTKPNSMIQKAQLYGMAFREQEQRELEKQFNKHITQDIRTRIINTTIINDFAIIETIKKWNEKEETVFFSVVNGKKINEVANNFDQALIIALSHKYGYAASAPIMIYNMLRMDKNEGSHEN